MIFLKILMTVQLLAFVTSFLLGTSNVFPVYSTKQKITDWVFHCSAGMFMFELVIIFIGAAWA